MVCSTLWWPQFKSIPLPQWHLMSCIAPSSVMRKKQQMTTFTDVTAPRRYCTMTLEVFGGPAGMSSPFVSTQFHFSVRMIKASTCTLLGTRIHQSKGISLTGCHTAPGATCVLADGWMDRWIVGRKLELELVLLDWRMPLYVETSRCSTTGHSDTRSLASPFLLALPR